MLKISSNLGKGSAWRLPPTLPHHTYPLGYFGIDLQLVLIVEAKLEWWHDN